MAMSDNGDVAVIDKVQNCVNLFGKGTLNGVDQQWMTRKLTKSFSRPFDICFGPNDYILVSDNGDASLKVFDLNSQKQVNQIAIGHDYYGKLVVQDSMRYKELNVRFKTIRVPQNIVVGPGPLYQLFVSIDVGIVLINMDWKEMIPLSYFLVQSPLHWCFIQHDMSLVCDNASSVKDHGVNHKFGGFNPLAITKAQFCAMFYHVTETRDLGFSCLDKSDCIVGKRQDRRKFSETVVVYVRVMDQKRRMIFHARYGNCYEGPHANTIHAEYFMLVDEDFRQAVKIIRDQKGGHINMYMNKQPCSRSTGHGKKTDLKIKDCSRDLVNFYHLHCSPYNIKLTISISQLYKVDMLAMLPQEASLVQDILNAQFGLRLLVSAGINVNAMTHECWGKLAQYAEIELPRYQGSNRQKLDIYIHSFLSDLKRTNFFPFLPW